ncbi:MAG: hypothetical protein HY646_21625 [Acidobacteria bacterium]|nr:hypothetical protein [Acidobacteriota bacterium]
MHRLKSRIAGVLCFTALGFAVGSAENNWPRFRGADGGVAADNPALPDVWGPSQNIVWKVDVAGRS